MGAVIKLRVTGGITGEGSAPTPFIGWKYTDGLNQYTEIVFNWMPERDEAFEAGKFAPDYNEELKRVIELDLVPSGEWTVTYDGFYLYIESQVAGRVIYPYMIFNTVVHTAEITNLTSADITFLQSIGNEDLLNAFNDNIIRFTGADLFKLDVSVNETLNAEVYVQPNGEFYMNLKDYATALINQNKFKDEVTPNIGTDGYVYPDPSLLLEMDLSFTYSVFTEAATFFFLKSVDQIIGYKHQKVKDNFFITPDKVTYYEGYPFDIALYSAKAQEVIIRNKTTLHEMAVQLDQYVNRIFLSQGSQNFTIDDVIPMQSGINRMEVEFSPTEKLDFIINKKQSNCAPYFKFYRNSGAWGYIRFHPEMLLRPKAKGGDEIVTDFDGIQNTLTRSLQNKQTSVEMEFQTDQLEQWEMENLQDIISSPRVEMYVEGLFQQQKTGSWVGVKVTSDSLDVRKPKSTRAREKIKIEVDLYNLHL